MGLSGGDTVPHPSPEISVPAVPALGKMSATVDISKEKGHSQLLYCLLTDSAIWGLLPGHM